MEKTVLAHLIFNNEYARKVYPFLKDEYFHDTPEKIVFGMIRDYMVEYGDFPNKESLYIELADKEDLNENVFDEVKNIIHDLEVDEATKLDWLVDKTEQFCQDKALFNAISESISIIDSGKTSLTKEAIPQLLQSALQVSFDTSVGHDVFNDLEERWEMYHRKHKHIPTGITYLDNISGGGFYGKGLFCFMAPAGVGKSLTMSSIATHQAKEGFNVLYISMEMSEEKISMRVDANLLDVDTTTLKHMEKDEFISRYNRQKESGEIRGRIIVKEFPTTGANANHFNHVMDELAIKNKFVPDIMYIDYLNICASTRYKAGSVNSYTYIKAIAEELRSIGVERDIPIVTATQVNRGATKSLDLDMEDVADSYGLIMTVDMMVGIVQDEELEEDNMYLFKQIKNRDFPLANPRRFMVGVDKSRMRLHDVKMEDQLNLLDGPNKDDNNQANIHKLKPRVQGFS